MKKIILGILVFTLIIAGGIMALAKKGNRDSSANRAGFREKMFDRIAKDLSLSDEQKTQSRAILEESKSRIEPLMRKIGENRQQAKELGTDGVYDEQKVQEIAGAQADLMKQVFIEKEKDKAQLFALLTAEQREQAKQKLNDFEGRFNKSRRGNYGNFKGGF